MTQFPKKLQDILSKKDELNMLQGLPSSIGLVDFSSNDYLGFATNETIYANTFQYLLSKGTSLNGATGSRLQSGNHDLYNELETYLRQQFKVESALVFNSEYEACLGLFSAIPQKDDIVLYDEFVHLGIRDGLRLGHAKTFDYKHNDLEDLQLKSETFSTEHTVYVVTESVFSRGGDSPDLKKLVEICNKIGAFLVVDEAHAFGIFGKTGEGLVQSLGLEKEVLARITSFGNALGSYGAAILCNNSVRQYLINFASSFECTTALPSHSLATTLMALKYWVSENGLSNLQQLEDNVGYFKEKVAYYKLTENFVPSDSPIQSCKLSEINETKKVTEKLIGKGFAVKFIFSPTGTMGEGLMRFSIHSHNTKEEIGLVVQLLSKLI